MKLCDKVFIIQLSKNDGLRFFYAMFHIEVIHKKIQDF